MNLTKLALRRPVSAVLLIIMIIIFGFTSFGDLEQELTPEMETPMLMIMTLYSGAGPEDVEDLVTSPLEDAIASLSDVKTVTSRSAENQSMIMIQYEYGTDMDGMILTESLHITKGICICRIRQKIFCMIK